MNFFARFLALFLLPLLLFCLSCTQKPAQIVNKSSEVYSRNNVKSGGKKYAATIREDVKQEAQKQVVGGDAVFSQPSEKRVEKKSESVTEIKGQEPSKKIAFSGVKEGSAAVTSGTASTKVFALKTQEEQVEVVAGDTLYSLSRKYQTTQEEIVKINNLNSPYNLKVGTKITIKKTSANSSAIKQSQQIEVGTGDTLLKISQDYQVTLRDLIKQNNLTPPYSLKVGQKLVIPAPNYHEVKPGETLYAISRLYNMKVDELIRMNDLKEPYAVKVGERIRITNLNDEIIAVEVKNKNGDIVAKNASQVAPVATSEPAKKVEIAQIKPQKAEKVGDKAEKKEEPVSMVATDKDNHFAWPIKGKIISKFGPKSGGLYNDGINIKGTAGTSVKSAEDGVVAYVGNELKGYGNLVIVKHSGGWITAYAHLADTLVKRGQRVAQGDKIGLVGATGNVKSSQLYFGLRKGRDAVNPENYIQK